MIHCQNAMHAEHGMLGREYVRELTYRASCDIVGPIPYPGLVDNVNKITVVGGSTKKQYPMLVEVKISQ